jgi:hypothetical protein
MQRGCREKGRAQGNGIEVMRELMWEYGLFEGTVEKRERWKLGAWNH